MSVNVSQHQPEPLTCLLQLQKQHCMLPYADAEEDISLGRNKTGYSTDGTGKCGSDTSTTGAAGFAYCKKQDLQALCQHRKPMLQYCCTRHFNVATELDVNISGTPDKFCSLVHD